MGCEVWLISGTLTSGPSRMSDGLQADLLEGLPYPPSHFDLYSLDQLQEDDRESDRYIHITVDVDVRWSTHKMLYFKLFLLN